MWRYNHDGAFELEIWLISVATMTYSLKGFFEPTETKRDNLREEEGKEWKAESASRSSAHGSFL